MQIEYNTNYRFERRDVLFITRFRFYFNLEDHTLLEQFPTEAFEIHLAISPTRYEDCSRSINHRQDELPHLTHHLKFSLDERSYREPVDAADERTWVTEEYSITQKARLINGLNIMDLINEVKSQASTLMSEAAEKAEKQLEKAHSRPQFHKIDPIDYRGGPS